MYKVLLFAKMRRSSITFALMAKYPQVLTHLILTYLGESRQLVSTWAGHGDSIFARKGEVFLSSDRHTCVYDEYGSLLRTYPFRTCALGHTYIASPLFLHTYDGRKAVALKPGNRGVFAFNRFYQSIPSSIYVYGEKTFLFERTQSEEIKSIQANDEHICAITQRNLIYMDKHGNKTHTCHLPKNYTHFAMEGENIYLADDKCIIEENTRTFTAASWTLPCPMKDFCVSEQRVYILGINRVYLYDSDVN